MFLFIYVKHNTDKSSKVFKPLLLVTAKKPTTNKISSPIRLARRVSVPVQLICTSAKVIHWKWSTLSAYYARSEF